MTKGVRSDGVNEAHLREVVALMRRDELSDAQIDQAIAYFSERKATNGKPRFDDCKLDTMICLGAEFYRRDREPPRIVLRYTRIKLQCGAHMWPKDQADGATGLQFLDNHDLTEAQAEADDWIPPTDPRLTALAATTGRDWQPDLALGCMPEFCMATKTTNGPVYIGMDADGIASFFALAYGPRADKWCPAAYLGPIDDPAIPVQLAKLLAEVEAQAGLPGNPMFELPKEATNDRDY
jgi:hypothetical protein